MSENAAAPATPARVLRGRHRIGADEADSGPDARTRIQEVALDLFIEHGYDKTSLREIAEALGVTKAALYYHFPTKDDIVKSLIDDHLTRFTALIEWAKGQPRTQETRKEFLRRYAEQLRLSQHRRIMEFFQRNQTSMKQMQSGNTMRDKMKETLALLAEPDDPATVRLRRALAFFAVHAGMFVFEGLEMSDEDRSSASLEVALDLIG